LFLFQCEDCGWLEDVLSSGDDEGLEVLGVSVGFKILFRFVLFVDDIDSFLFFNSEDFISVVSWLCSGFLH
jgi:hypothetical protein